MEPRRDSASRLVLLAPPYRTFTEIQPRWKPARVPPRGLALIWWVREGTGANGEFDRLRGRIPGLPLFVILPPPEEIHRIAPVLERIHLLRPRGVLPDGQLIQPAHLGSLLREPPPHLSAAVSDYLSVRGLLPGALRSDITKIFHYAPVVSSVSELSRRLYRSRRTLGRHFLAAGIPVPSHWLQFARLLHVAINLQREQAPVLRAAMRAGYPDAFTLSNQMKRLIEVRPSEVREHFGWEWIVEAWLRQEARNGGFDYGRYGGLLQHYRDITRGDPRMPS